nr:unnamed protein product [Callosobruchus analis]
MRSNSINRSRSRSPDGNKLVSSKAHRSKSRSPSRRGRSSSRPSHSKSRDIDHPKSHDDRRGRNGYFNHRCKDSKKMTSEDDFMESRRRQREIVGMRYLPNIWGKSPERADVVMSEEDVPEKHHHKDNKRKMRSIAKKRSRARGKRAKRRIRRKSDSSASSAEEEWVEKTSPEEILAKKDVSKSMDSDSDKDIGPLPKSHGTLTHREMGGALLPGEGAAMAAYVAEGKRIPRRDEKRALATFSKEERQKRENLILGQFREMISSKLAGKKH